MYGLRYSNQVDELSKRDFAILCVTLLKLEVSHDVQQVSTQGADGMRDAWLEGYNNRSKISGKWLFQFKQYSSELSVARRKMIQDFKMEMKKSFQYYKDLTGYFFITNVPHSGTGQKGTFDKVKAIISQESEKEKVVQFWDGQELCNLIDLHYARVEHLVFPDKQYDLTERSLLIEKHNTQTILLKGDFVNYWENENHNLLLNRNAVIHYTDTLIGTTGELLFSPQNESSMLRLFYQGKYREMITLGNGCRKMLFKYREQQNFQYLSLNLLITLAYAKTGKICEAQFLLNEFESLKCQDRLLWGYYFDIQSLLAEKENNYSVVQECSKKGWGVYEEYGIGFNLNEWKLRQIHKMDWNACESVERSVNNEEFNDALQLNDTEINLTPKEKRYIKSMKAVYSALHYTWENSYLEDAENYITVGLDYFQEINCLPELARLFSEKGRISLKSKFGSKDSVKYLKMGLNFRIRTGEMGRIRYDLLWLGQAYLQIQNEYFATLVSVVSRYIHFYILRFNNTTDMGLLKKLSIILNDKRSKEFVSYIKKTDFFYGDLECATDVSADFWIQLVDERVLLTEMEGIK